MRAPAAACLLTAFAAAGAPCTWCAEHHATGSACKQTSRNFSTCHNHHDGCKDLCNK